VYELDDLDASPVRRGCNVSSSVSAKANWNRHDCGLKDSAGHVLFEVACEVQKDLACDFYWVHTTIAIRIRVEREKWPVAISEISLNASNSSRPNRICFTDALFRGIAYLNRGSAPHG
jgi:hypothetical protein